MDFKITDKQVYFFVRRYSLMTDWEGKSFKNNQEFEFFQKQHTDQGKPAPDYNKPLQAKLEEAILKIQDHYISEGVWSQEAFQQFVEYDKLPQEIVDIIDTEGVDLSPEAFQKKEKYKVDLSSLSKLNKKGLSKKAMLESLAATTS